jgi:hypothetical protein
MVGNVREWVSVSVESASLQYRMRGGGRDTSSEKALVCSSEQALSDGSGKATTGFRIAVTRHAG